MALLPEYTWDAKASRYRSEATGRFVAQTEIVRQLDKVSDASRDNIKALTQRLIDKQITVQDWRAQMAHEIKIVHTYSGAAARGGWAQMSQADWGRVGWNIRRQYEYLNNFAAEVASGKQALNGQCLTRAQMYGRAGHATFEDMRQRDAMLKGLTEERRLLRAAESCPDCIEYAGLGWQPIGTLPRITESQCRTNCRCIFEYGSRNMGDIVIDPSYINPVNPITDKNKYKSLVFSMGEGGWKGRPVLVYKSGDNYQALTGSHRIYAAQEAGINVPISEIDTSKLKASQIEEMNSLGYLDDDDKYKYLKTLYDQKRILKSQLDLMLQEVSENDKKTKENYKEAASKYDAKKKAEKEKELQREREKEEAKKREAKKETPAKIRLKEFIARMRTKYGGENMWSMMTDTEYSEYEKLESAASRG